MALLCRDYSSEDCADDVEESTFFKIVTQSTSEIAKLCLVNTEAMTKVDNTLDIFTFFCRHERTT